MATVQQQPLDTATPPPARLPNPFLKFWQEELGYIFRGLRAWLLFGLVLGTVLLFGIAYQARQEFEFRLGPINPTDYLYATSFTPPESNAEQNFRWSTDYSTLRFPGMGRVPAAQLEISMEVGGRPANLGPAIIQVWSDDKLLGQVEVGPGTNVYRFDYRADGGKLDGNLVFVLKSPNAFPDAGHKANLGAVVSKVRLVAGSADGRPVIPPLLYTAFLLAALIVVYLALYRAGWNAFYAAGFSGGLAIGTAWAIASARMQLMPAVETLFMTILLAYPIMVIGLRVTARWFKDSFPKNQARWLGLIFVAAFVAKAAGMNHPGFITVDHWFRVHQVLRFWDNPGEFWTQYYNINAGKSVTGAESGSAVLGQWGVNFTLPYSPLFYLLASPLALIWPGHNSNLLAAVNILSSWLEVSQVFLIYIIARRAYKGEWAGRAGVIAAAFLGFYPLSFLLPSDGGYNSILAHWLTLLFIVQLLGLVQAAQPSRLAFILTGLTLGAALLTHTSTLLLLGTFVTILLGLWLFSLDTRPAGKRLAVVAGIGFGLSLLLYYGYYVIGFFSQSLPALLDRLKNGGSIGQNPTFLKGNLLTGFWPQLWEHFRLFPFILTLIALVLLWPYRKQKDAASGNPTNYLILIAWLITFLLFALVDLKVNLLQKHMLFVAPLLGLGTGFALSLLWQWLSDRRAQTPSASKSLIFHPLVASVLTGLLLTFLIWQGLLLWYSRVYSYSLPPGSG